MRQGVAKRVSQFKSTGSSYFDEGYKAGWEAAKKYYTKENEMPVPEGVITSTDTMSGVAPKEENDQDQEATTTDPSSDTEDSSGQDTEDK